MQENRTWTRWVEIVALVAGAVLALSPIWVSVGANGIATMIVLGALIFLAGLFGVAVSSGQVPASWSNLILGVLTFIAPWVIGYYHAPGAAWTSWVVGVVAFIVGLVTLAPKASLAPRRTLAHGSR